MRSRRTMKATLKSKILHLAANVLVLSAISASAAIRYVNVNGASPTLPYTDWTTAATTIQDAVDAAEDGDQIVVTNGVYQIGDRVSVTKVIMVRSVNGAPVTVIDGKGGAGCVYLASGAA